MIGQIVKQYKITGKLGEGGMGEVYLAEDTKLNRQVALKFLPRLFSSDPDARARFQREAKALATLNHPNIVTVFDVSEHDGQPFIAMEYLEGQSLKEIIASTDLDTDRVIDYVSQIAEGLAAAHKAAVIHRDVKSENIIVSSEGRVKIMDFGLATWHGVTQITQEGSTLGTMAYMSPEQTQGKDVDQRADLWSLGVVLYEMLTRRLPFAGEHQAAVAYSIVNDTPQPLGRYSSDVPSELQRIVNKCLAKDREERYQSAADLVADLRALRRFSAVGEERLPRRSRKRPAAIAISASVAAVIAILLLILEPWKIEGQPRPEAQAAPKTLAVLPFENLGAAEDEYFADGITDEIASRLARISGLRVISRTSSMHYKDSDESLRTIGAELGVDYIINGTIRWDKSGTTNIVRITPQLIHVAEDYSVWSESYERSLTQIFAVQSEIAEEIAGALDVTFQNSGKRASEDTPTENMEAYDSYLRGLEYFNRGNNEFELRAAIAMFEDAVSLDSTFALAFARLALVQARLHFWWEFGISDRWQEAERSAARALALAPHLPEAYLARGVIQNYIYREYDSALASFARAEEGMGNPSDLYAEIAVVNRRQGEWLASLDHYKKALELDPHSARKIADLVSISRDMRRHEEAVHYARRAIKIAPDSPWGYMSLISVQIASGSGFDEVRKMLKEASTLINPAKVLASEWEFPLGFLRLGLWDEIAADPAALPRSFYTEFVSHDYYRSVGQIYNNLGDSERARIYFDSARIDIMRKLDEHHETIAVSGFRHQNDFDLHTRLGTVYAYLGEKDLAIMEGLRGVELMPISDCFW